MGRYPTFMVADYVDVLHYIYNLSHEEICTRTKIELAPIRTKNLERYPNDRAVLRLVAELDRLNYFCDYELSLAQKKSRQLLQLAPPIPVLRLIISELFNALSVEEFLQCAVRRFNSLSEATKLWFERTESSVRICHQYFYEDENFGGPQRFFLSLIDRLTTIFSIPKSEIRVTFSNQGIRDEPGFVKRTGCQIDFKGDFSSIEIFEHAKYINPVHNQLTQIAISEALDDLMEPMEMDLVASVERILERNLSDHRRSMDIEATASLMGMSRKTLHRRLAEKGRSFKDLRSKIRLEYAAKLLRSTEYDISDISELLGYSASSAFCRAFKAQNSCSPLDYRSLNQ